MVWFPNNLYLWFSTWFLWCYCYHVTCYPINFWTYDVGGSFFPLLIYCWYAWVGCWPHQWFLCSICFLITKSSEHVFIFCSHSHFHAWYSLTTGFMVHFSLLVSFNIVFSYECNCKLCASPIKNMIFISYSSFVFDILFQKKQNIVTRDKEEIELIARGQHDLCVVPWGVMNEMASVWLGPLLTY